MLEVRDLKYSYGRIEVLHGISISVQSGEVVALIGANGAGKTTTLRCISALQSPSAGSIRFADQEISRWAPDRILRLGMAHVPEGRRAFPELSVLDNLMLGGYAVTERRLLGERLEAVFARFPRLRERRNQMAGTLSGGEQQMLALGRALMSGPKMLMLDEPSMGLAPKLVDEVFEIIAGIRTQGVTVLLVEQNANRSLEIADRAYVLQNGRITASGAAKELSRDERIRQAYLGG